MKIKVNNQIEIINAVDMNGIDYTEYLAEILDLVHYESADVFYMSETDFTRFKKLVDMHNEITALELKLSDTERAEYEDLPDYPDFDYTVAKKLEWLRSKIHE